jgi:hypothetical protein
VILNKFNEGQLNFDPTYKYDDNCEVYDTSQKMRIPAWCDRVLFSRDAQFKQHLISDKMAGDENKASLPVFYNRRNSSFSDHRPVLAIYQTQVVKVNKEKKEALRQQILSRLMGAEKVSKVTLAEANMQTSDYSRIMDIPREERKVDDIRIVKVETVDLISFTPSPTKVPEQKKNNPFL